MNCWGSLWPTGSPFGVPRHVDPAGIVLHSIPPVLLIVLAEAITHYRRAILDRIAFLREPVDSTDHPAAVPPVPAYTAPPPPAPAEEPKAAPRKRPAKAPAKSQSARRSLPDLLAEARSLTVQWPDSKLTADGLREALHCGAAQARTIRDALKNERAASPALRSVDSPDAGTTDAEGEAA
jgi:hypothetical protein